MRILLTVLLFGLFAGSFVACDGGGEGEQCDFDFDAILNGANTELANSEWTCIDNFEQVFTVRVFEDGTGFSSSVGFFTFQQTGCRSLDFQSAVGNATVSNLQGSIDSGIVTFFQSSSILELDGISASCILVIL